MHSIDIQRRKDVRRLTILQNSVATFAFPWFRLASGRKSVAGLFFETLVRVTDRDSMNHEITREAIVY